jgi:hypothetical protein
MKQKTNREKENEKTRGKKRFIERVAEEKEAEQQIKEFDRNEDIIIGETYLDDTKRRTTNR